MEQIDVRPVTSADRAWLAEKAVELWHGDFVVSRGAVHRVAELAGFVAWTGGERVGVATYRFGTDDCELVTINALREHIGVGTALLSAVKEVARGRRLWLVTTNDNLDAIRFYQRRGFVLTELYPNAIAAKRRLKPRIPLVGSYGIAIRDELVFTLSE